jgi:hypothetical protein
MQPVLPEKPKVNTNKKLLSTEPLAKLSVISRKQFHRQPLAVDFLR